jgi:lysophospholipase L1-like esterase
VKAKFIFVWLATCLSVFAGEPQLIECVPRGGLPNFFAKLERGETVGICYFGGSITAQEGWRPKTLAWFQQQYPQASISQINAAIGGTGSDLGAFRLRHDALDQKPDLIFVEFAVNDGSMPPERIYRSMEGIIRQAWRDNPATDICFVYTISGAMLNDVKTEKLPRAYEAMEKIAEYYHIPSIKMGLEAARLARAGKLVFTGTKPKTDDEKAALGDKILFSPDSVHPYTDSGHQLYLDAVVRGMALIKPVGKAVPHELNEPFMADNWEDAKMIPLDQAKLSAGWKKLDPTTNSVAKNFANRLPWLWKANQPGDAIEFKFKGTDVAIYDAVGPDCGQVIITLDDQKPMIKPRFDAYCTYYRLMYFDIGSNLSNTMHTVKVEIHPDQPDKVSILAQRKEKMDDPKRFNDRAWYAGALLLVGNLVK